MERSPDQKNPALLGFQIVSTETDDPPEGMTTYEVYPLTFVIDWLRNRPDEEKPDWRLLPVFNGDVEEPVFPYGFDESGA